MSTWLPRCAARISDRPLGRLAGRGARGRRLQPVVDSVAHQVEQRLVERLDEQLVQLGVLAGQHDAGALAQAVGQVAHGAVVLAHDAADRDHAQAHDRLAQLGRHRVEAARRSIQLLGDVAEHALDPPQLVAQLAQRGDRCGSRDRPRVGGTGGCARLAQVGHHLQAAGQLAIGGQLVAQRGERADRAAQAVAPEDQLADQVEQVIELVEIDPDCLAALGQRRGVGRRRGHRSRGGAACARIAQLLDQRRGVDRHRLAPAGPPGDVAQRIERGQQRIDDRPLRPHPAVAQLPDQIFRGMSQVVHRPQPDHCRRALDGVQVAKHIAQKLRVLWPSLDIDELDGQRLEPLVHLGKEQLDHVVIDRRRPRDLRRSRLPGLCRLPAARCRLPVACRLFPYPGKRHRSPVAPRLLPVSCFCSNRSRRPSTPPQTTHQHIRPAARHAPRHRQQRLQLVPRRLKRKPLDPRPRSIRVGQQIERLHQRVRGRHHVRQHQLAQHVTGQRPVDHALGCQRQAPDRLGAHEQRLRRDREGQVGGAAQRGARLVAVEPVEDQRVEHAGQPARLGHTAGHELGPQVAHSPSPLSAPLRLSHRRVLCRSATSDTSTPAARAAEQARRSTRPAASSR